MQLRRATGKIEFSTLAFLAIAAAGFYFGAMYIPIYIDDYHVKTAIREAQNGAIHDPSDEKVRSMIVERCSRIGSHYVTEDGVEKELPGIGLEPYDVQVMRDASASTIVVELKYVRSFNYPFSARRASMEFSHRLAGNLEKPRW